MKKITLIVLLVAGFAIRAGEISERTEKTIQDFFGDSVSLSKVKVTLPEKIRLEVERKCQQKFFSEYLYAWKIHQGGELLGIAILDNVYGKSQPITFLVIFNTKGEVVKSSIVKYREQHGYQVRDENWQKQFVGLSGTSDERKYSEIDSISGATISSASITKGIRKLVLAFNWIKELL